MLLGELIKGLDIRATGPDTVSAGRTRVCDITEDSRTVMPGSLFVARRGEHADGRKFAPGAVAAGAVAVLTDDPTLVVPSAHAHAGPPPVVLATGDLELASAQLAERFYGNPSSKLVMIGVTGTNGKTTITFLIHQLLNAMGIRTGLIGTVQVDDGREVAPASLTTPPAIELSRTLATMVESGCRAAVMEVSSHALHQRRVGALTFDVAAFTNLTGDHLDYHKTMEEYAAAKAMLFESLGTEACAVVNADDSWHERMIRGCRASVVRCTLGGDAAAVMHDPRLCTAIVREADQRRTRLLLTGGAWSGMDVSVRLIGRHNVMNVLQAVAVVHEAIRRLDAAAPRATEADFARLVADLTPPPGRLEPVSTEADDVTVFVDYAHSDDAVRNVLTTVRATMAAESGSRLWVVFGCGGDRDKTKRPRMGAAAAELADRVVVTSDNPRTEQPSSIIDGILTGIGSADRERVIVDADRETAIRRAVLEASSGDVIVIAGKGHEDYQILPDGRGGTVTRPFSDRLAARSALQARAGAAPGVVTRSGASGTTKRTKAT